MAYKTVKVKAFPNPKSLSEIYQATGFHFAFCAAPTSTLGRIQAHEWAKCRDFLPDAARAVLTSKSCSIYGFNYDPAKNPPLDMQKMRMLVCKKSMKTKADVTAFEKKIDNALLILNHYEKIAKITLTRLYRVIHEKDTKEFDSVFMFYGSGAWMKSPFLISMYTFLIRLGDKELQFNTTEELKKALKKLNEDKQAGKYEKDNDASYIAHSWDKLDLILKHREKLFPEKNGFHDINFAGHDIGAFHNNTGVLALVKGSTPDSELNKRAKEIFK